MLQGRWRFEGVDYFFAYPVSRDSGFATFQPMSQFGLYTCNETLRFWDDGEYPEIAEKHNHTVLCFVAEISRALRRLSPPEEIFAAACAQRRSEFEN
ncbi:MAG TPA: hypothetical protein DDZ68_06355 [Parvularcula sp.]|nr:hypothetical protein [Parvularcula sp.]HBS30888.1 hypothetical protein [Parvularcula sp.]